MESEKQKILMPSAGICNLTPDKVCNDNELLDSDGITFSDDAIRILRPPHKMLEGTAGTLAYVHALNDGKTKNYIYINGTHFNDIDAGATITDVKAIGNMLILNTSAGLRYYLWKPDGYSYLGNSIPEPQVRFSLVIAGEKSSPNPVQSVEMYTSQTNVASLIEVTDNGTTIKVSKENVHGVEDGILGAYAEMKNRIAESGLFHSPFFATYALELVDGTYYKIGTPVLMLPSILVGALVQRTADNYLSVGTRAYALRYQVLNKHVYSSWSDIIKGVTIFVSPQYDVVRGVKQLYTGSEGYSISSGSVTKINIYSVGIIYPSVIHVNSNNIEFPFFDRLTKGELFEQMKNIVFFKLMDAGLDGDSTSARDAVRNLTSQPRLEHIDFFSHCAYSASGMQTFNRRLNLWGVSRSFFEGFTHFMPYNLNNNGNGYELAFQKHYYTVEVTISTDYGTSVVSHSFESDDIFSTKMWFYYPDPRATSVTVKAGGTVLFTKQLTEHNSLNGAYFLDFPDGTESVPVSTGNTAISLPTPELLPNYLLQSEVDNPFTFLSSGYVRVGQGTIIGMAALTTALSQDMYKVATTIAFTTQGIWALTNDNTGRYASVTPPFSREVCNNPASITMADNTVFFTSDKGLMMITDNGIKNVTHQLSGKVPQSPFPEALPTGITPFRNFLKTCRIAYDYRNNHLWLIATVPDGSPSGYHWIYNINSGAVTRFTDNNRYKAIVADYPDTLLQTTTGALYSMNQRPDINDDTKHYNALFITRPVKFSDSVRLKSIREFLHIHDLSEGATLTVTIYGSNDCRQWHKLDSLYGSGFKFFTFKYEFHDCRAVDTFSGTLIGYDLRQTNKLR